MRTITLSAVALLILMTLAGCSKGKEPQRAATPVRTALVETIDSVSPIRYSANIAPFTQVELSFKSGGVVQSLRQVRGADGRMRSVQEGDWVAKGTVLASVRQDEYRDKLDQAKAALARVQATYEHATLDWQRAQILFDQRALTKPDYDSAKAQYDSTAAAVDEAKAQLKQAEIALRDCAIISPVDAWVLKRNAEIGMVVTQVANAFIIADTRKVKAVFGVPDLMVSRVKLGAKQAITVEAVPSAFEGRVTAISAAADPKSRVYSVEVTIPNLHNQLRSGMIASLEFASEAPTLKQPAVELEAVVRHPGTPNAFAVYIAEGSPATARVRAIEPGEPHGNRVVVLKGLKPGERVITTGATLIKDGDPVNVIP